MTRYFASYDEAFKWLSTQTQVSELLYSDDGRVAETGCSLFLFVRIRLSICEWRIDI